MRTQPQRLILSDIALWKRKSREAILRVIIKVMPARFSVKPQRRMLYLNIPLLEAQQTIFREFYSRRLIKINSRVSFKVRLANKRVMWALIPIWAPSREIQFQFSCLAQVHDSNCNLISWLKNWSWNEPEERSLRIRCKIWRRSLSNSNYNRRRRVKI